jgi:hypothetical protein
VEARELAWLAAVELVALVARHSAGLLQIQLVALEQLVLFQRPVQVALLQMVLYQVVLAVLGLVIVQTL